MVEHITKLRSAIFITFAGNCKMALTFYQSCFGGKLQFETFEEIRGYPEVVVCGSLVSERIIIHGSDLVHDEGRIAGNYLSVFLQCENANDRKELIEKLSGKKKVLVQHSNEDKLIEVTDAFDVRWVLGLTAKYTE